MSYDSWKENIPEPTEDEIFIIDRVLDLVPSQLRQEYKRYLDCDQDDDGVDLYPTEDEMRHRLIDHLTEGMYR